MSIKLKMISAILSLAMLSPLAINLYAEDGNTVKKYEAEIMNVKGGADSIVTLTFDDGIVHTARKLNEMLPEYGLRASLMMFASRVDKETFTTAEEWNEIFAKGYLEPESHSMNHDYIGGNSAHASYSPEHETPENIHEEIVESYKLLSEKFPNYDILTYAIPNSVYIAEAKAAMKATYYAARGGRCTYETLDVIPEKYTVQPINPKTDLSAGGWYDPYIARLPAASSSENVTMEEILAYLDDCVKYNGWFISLCHAIGVKHEADDPEAGYHHDMTDEQARTLFAKIAEYVDAGKVWCTTYGEATKYVREFQNSKAYQYEQDGALFCEIEMAETTEDGLSLPADIFDVPLTVKIAVPTSWGSVRYVQGNTEGVAKTFMENGRMYAYIDVVPNSTAARIDNPFDSTEYMNSLDVKENVTLSTSLDYNLYIPTDSYVESVNYLGESLEAEELTNGYTVYKIKDIFVTDIEAKYSLTVNFSSDSAYDRYSMELSVMSYLEKVAASPDTPEADKQLIFDFVSYAKGVYLHLLDSSLTPDTSGYDRILSLLDGYTLGYTECSEGADMGNMSDAVYGVGFAMNEKPYYLFYLKSGFTGTVTVSTGDGEEARESSFDVVNGFYHCKDYVIFEVDGVYSLTDDVKLSAIGKIAEAEINASGSYSVENFMSGMLAEGDAPEYISALFSYANTARSYKEKQENN